MAHEPRTIIIPTRFAVQHQLVGVGFLKIVQKADENRQHVYF
jgi:hypothetical protein